MCGFKPGDEVVCVDSQGCPELIQGAPYVIERVLFEGDEFFCHDGMRVVATSGSGVWVYGGFDFRDSRCPHSSYTTRRFRKVERKNDSLSIEAFLTIKPGFEEPKRTPAKKRERV